MITPDWPVPPGVHARCSTRGGGVSAPPYDTLNLGDHVGDDAANVAANRGLYADALQARPVFLQQVHGRGVVQLSHATVDGTEADACWTTERGLACTMMVADCLPVLLADRRGSVVGAAHCGWRGLAGEQGAGVLEALWNAMAPHAGNASGMVAWLGPCIGPEAFEVGAEVRAAFVEGDAQAARCFRPRGEGKFLADLPALARRRLAALGIGSVHGNDGSTQWCTVANASRFFSHRRDRVSG
ncbi:MAG TPA: peptidoglycan editing factor PgeF, partial [Ramlibacter sp.]|nr:peptidoglycan editing factor PgeF [Ramlibacter sp.]